MAGALKSLLYVSKCVAPLDDDQVYRLYKAAADFNALDGISGILIHDGNAFLQLIEGGEEAIAALMQRLRRDPRHCDIEVRDERFVDQRSFGTWTMKLVKISRAHMAAVQDLGGELGTKVDPAIRALIIDALHELSQDD